MGNSYKFNTADYEEVLVEAGLDKPLAKAHRVALEEALEQVVTVDKLDQAVARIELAIAIQSTNFAKEMASQSARFDLAIANQNTKIEGQTKVFIGVMSLLLALVTAIIKFG